MDETLRKHHSLPEDVIIEIQLRLPVKSLLRFRSVCRTWNARFRNPEFIDAHYQKQKDLEIDNFSNSKLLLICHRHSRASIFHRYYFFSSLRRDLGCEKTVVPDEYIHMPFTIDTFASHQRIFGSCNGVFCLDNYYSSINRYGLALWNPATRECNILPPSNIWHAGIIVRFVLAFGYDHKTDDYKVLRLTSYLGRRLTHRQVELYSLRRNIWKEINADCDLDLRDISPLFNGYVNGMCHMYWRNAVLSFNVADETFTTTPIPDFGIEPIREGRYYDDWELRTYQDSAVCIVHTVEERRRTFDLWVLNEIGAKESWTKLFRVGPILGVHSFLGFSKNDCTFIKTDDGKLGIYDRKRGKIGKQRIISDDLEVLELVNYVDSLVPINGRSEKGANICRVAIH